MPTITRVIGSPLSSLTLDDESGPGVSLRFEKSKVANIFARWQFNSQILHSFVLDEDNPPFWIEGERLNCHIQGFPPGVNFRRQITNTQEFILEGEIDDLEDYANTLSVALNHILIKHDFSNYQCIRFTIIQEDDSSLEYHFVKGGREVTGFMILYSLERLWRDQIRFYMDPRATYWPQVSEWGWPDRIPADGELYGDPSKAIQSAEQSGWGGRYDDDDTAFSQGMGSYSNKPQKWYQFHTREQNIDAMRARSPIPRRWRVELHERDNWTCLYCGRTGDPDDWTGTGTSATHRTLDPDHRIPVNIRSDELDDDNFLEHLMTLCKPCNQRKRELTKALQRDGFEDWDNWEWAHPERLDFVIQRIYGQISVINDMMEWSQESESDSETIDAVINNCNRIIDRLQSML